MNDMSKGLVLVLSGLIFLLISLVLPFPTIARIVLCGASLIMNVAGTTFLIKYIRTTEEDKK
jgi:hypothetical protein